MIYGKTIKLVALSSDHHQFMLSLLNDEETAHNEGKVEFPVSIDAQRLWYEKYLHNRNAHSFIIMSKEDDTIYGYLSFKILNEVSRNGHLAIKLCKEARGKGYGTDALKTAMKFLFFQYNMHRLTSHIIDYNIASQKLFIDKCGWKKEGTAREAIYMNGKYYDNILIGILKEDFIKNEKDNFYNVVLKK